MDNEDITDIIFDFLDSLVEASSSMLTVLFNLLGGMLGDFLAGDYGAPAILSLAAVSLISGGVLAYKLSR